jgi:hypothetical protein
MDNNCCSQKIKRFAWDVLLSMTTIQNMDDDTKLFMLTHLMETCKGLNMKKKEPPVVQYWVHLHLSVYKAIKDPKLLEKSHPYDHHSKNFHKCGDEECKENFHESMKEILNSYEEFKEWEGNVNEIILKSLNEIKQTDSLKGLKLLKKTERKLFIVKLKGLLMFRLDEVCDQSHTDKKKRISSITPSY